MHCDELRYTWRQRKPEIHSRLDYCCFFFINQGLSVNVLHSDITPSDRSDDSMVTLSITLHVKPRGPATGN